MEGLVVGVFGNRVKWYLFQRNRGTISATFDGNRPAKKILGTIEHRETKFLIWGKAIYFTGPCTPTPYPCEGLDGQWIIRPKYRHKQHNSF